MYLLLQYGSHLTVEKVSDLIFIFLMHNVVGGILQQPTLHVLGDMPI